MNREVFSFYHLLLCNLTVILLHEKQSSEACFALLGLGLECNVDALRCPFPSSDMCSHNAYTFFISSSFSQHSLILLPSKSAACAKVISYRFRIYFNFQICFDAGACGKLIGSRISQTRCAIYAFRSRWSWKWWKSRAATATTWALFMYWTPLGSGICSVLGLLTCYLSMCVLPGMIFQ